MIGAIGDVLGAAKAHAFDVADLCQRIGLHIYHLAMHARGASLEAIPAAAQTRRQVGKHPREIQLRWDPLVRRVAVRKSQCTDVHVALYEAVAGHHCAGRKMTATSCSEIYHERRRQSGCAVMRQAASQRHRCIDLADPRVEHRHTLLFEHVLSFDLQRHHDQHWGQLRIDHGHPNTASPTSVQSPTRLSRYT